MKIKFIKILGLLLVTTLLTWSYSEAGQHYGDKLKNKNSVTGTPAVTKFNINQISTYLYADGRSDIQSGNSGFSYPKGSGHTAFYQSGFIFGGRVNGEFRVGGTTYQTGLTPGAVINGVPQDPASPDVRIFRVRPDYASANLGPEVADGAGPSEAAVKAQYEKDWNEWPANLGAPYEDVDGNGSYDPTVDIPGVPGADQTVWCVLNDFDADNTNSLYGAAPLGVEVQMTYWGYNSTGALGSTMFRRYTIINKNQNQNDITEMYVSMWSDPDLGGAGDDYVGCDTLTSLGYVYNGTPTDGQYGDHPPAAGFDFFQGPIVDGEATDTAIFKGKYVPGKKNLPMTAFYFFINSDPIYTDPTFGDYATGTLQWYNLFRGRVSATGDPFTVPDAAGGGTTKFALSGDPVTGTGWVDGMLHAPDDRRLGQVSGTFTLAYGDTQEVVVSQMAAGGVSGIDRLQALSLLRSYDEIAQIAYDRFFELPSAPDRPEVTASELDKEIVLSWGADIANVQKTEGYDDFGYKFEGYNVYQLPSRSATLGEAIRIATFDIVNGVKLITDNLFDPNAGAIVEQATAFGTDAGIKRFFVVTSDAVNGNIPLRNGSKYYFAVTAYGYNPSPLFGTKVLENSVQSIEVTPHAPNPGTRYGSSTEAAFTAEHSGPSDGSVEVVTVAPDQTTGDDYKVSFEKLAEFVSPAGDTLHNVTVWHLDNVTTGERVLANQLEQGVGKASPIADGLQIQVQGPPPGIKLVHEIDQAGEEVDDGIDAYFHVSLGSTGYLLENRAGVGNSIGAYERDFDRFDYWGTDDVQINFGEESLTWDYISEEVHFKASDGTAYMAPFSIYRLLFPDRTPQRIFAGFWDVDGDGTWNVSVDANGDPNFSGPVYGAPSYEAIYAWVGYDASGNEIPYDPANNAQYEADNSLATSANTTFGSATGPFVYPYVTATLVTMYGSGATPPYGNIIEFITNKPNSANDTFTFTAPGVTNNPDLAKQDVEEIKAFPNPYYGVNSQELNKYQKFVTFSHMPEKAKIRIFNLAGQLVRVMDKDDVSQFQRWDLANDEGLPVASGLYIVHIDMPDLGKTKILKLAIIQEEQFLDRF